jgi:site-specific DNA-cytosine methylase
VGISVHGVAAVVRGMAGGSAVHAERGHDGEAVLPRRYVSLFAGAGGLDLGLERAGWEPLWFCENDKSCRKVLHAHWTDVPIIEDVKDVGSEPWHLGGGEPEPPRLDLLVGGF